MPSVRPLMPAQGAAAASAAGANSSSHASIRLAEIVRIAQQLQDHTTAEFRVYMQFFAAHHRGVRVFVPACMQAWVMFLN